MRTTQSVDDRRFASLLLLFASTGLGCEVHTAGSHSEPGESLMSLASTLQAAVAACASAAQSCEQSSGDSGADRASCRTQFESCQDAAKEAAKPDIDKAVNPCIDAFKGCREAAQASAAKNACAETLHTCLGEGQADASVAKPGEDADAEPHESKAPVVTCISALHTCIEGDTPAHDCTDSLRECIAGLVGHNGNADAGKPDDGGGSDHAHADGGTPDEPGHADGGGKPEQPGNSGDGGKPAPEADAGAPSADAGKEDDAKACTEAHAQCLSDGGTSDSCARARKACREP